MPLPDLNQHKLNFLSARSRAEPSKQTNKPQTGQKTHICTISRKQKNEAKEVGKREINISTEILKRITLRKIAPSLRVAENRL